MAYIHIASASLQHYIIKCDASPEELSRFLSRLRFPFSVLCWEGWRGQLFGKGLKILEEIDTIKQVKNDFRWLCFAYSVAPILSAIPMIIILFTPAITQQQTANSQLALFCLLLIAVSLFISWRFGHSLCKGKSDTLP